MPTQTTMRMPTYFISHGGGPWPWIKDQMPGDMSKLETSLQAIPNDVPTTPRAILVISGHWETENFTVQGHPNPPMFYDYGGFPEFTYHIQYPAPGSPEVAKRVAELLNQSDIPVRFDNKRGFDHGVFAPLYVSYPKADVPILQLSIKRGFDPSAHLAAGKALTPLRDEGVLIIGSGLSFHNMGAFGPVAEEPSLEFDNWLNETLLDNSATERTSKLINWEQAPSARFCHPAEDHLIPLMVAVGAAGNDAGTCVYREHDFAGSVSTSSFRFG